MKKNLILIVAVLLTSTFAFAQSGKMFVTGTLGYNNINNSSTYKTNNVTTTVDEPTSSDFNIFGQFHYMVTDNIAVGLGLGYDQSRAWYRVVNNTNLNNYSSMFHIVPSVIYFINITDNFKYAPELFLDFGFGSLTHERWDGLNNAIVNEKDDQSLFGIALMPLSFNYNFNKNIALTFSLGEISYNMYKRTDDFNEPLTTIERKTNTFNIALNTGFRVGFRYFF